MQYAKFPIVLFVQESGNCNIEERKTYGWSFPEIVAKLVSCNKLGDMG